MSFSNLTLLSLQKKMSEAFEHVYAYESEEAKGIARKCLMRFYGLDRTHYPLYFSRALYTLKFKQFPLSLEFFEEASVSSEFNITSFGKLKEDLEYLNSAEGINHFYQLFFDCIALKLPVPYLLGESEFRGLPFKVNASTLIPRVDSEVLVEQVLAYLESSALTEINALELCTGTGALGISAYLEARERFPLLNLDLKLTDISPKTLEVAKENLKTYALEKNIELLESDVWVNVPREAFNLIFLNPPYISRDEKHLMSESTLLYEPDLALFAEHQGLAFYEAFFEDLAFYVTEGTAVFMEMGFNQEKDLTLLWKRTQEKCAKSFPCFVSAKFKVIPDEAGHSRVFSIYF